jgi:hypothetical protein
MEVSSLKLADTLVVTNIDRVKYSRFGDMCVCVRVRVRVLQSQYLHCTMYYAKV